MRLSEYSDKIGIPEKYLTDYLAVSDYQAKDGSTNLVIPYLDEDSQVFRERIRNGSKRWWSEGDSIVPYGLNWLNGSKYVILAEGESDTQTLLYNGYPVLGIPGASTFKTEWVDKYLKHYKKIILVPDNDCAGNKLAEDISNKLAKAGYQGEVKRLILPESIKDINELFNKAGHSTDSFKTLFESLEAVTLAENGNDVSSGIIHPPSRSLGVQDGMMNNLLPIVELNTLEEPEPMTFIVEDMLPDNYLSVIFGDGAAGKSYLALTLACCVTTRTSFLGKQVVKANALYLDFELEDKEQTRRAYRVARGLGLEKPPKGLFYLQAGANENVPAKLNNLIKPLLATIAANDIRLVIVDSAGMAIEGDSEKAKDVIPLFQALRKLKVSVLLIDHQSKPKQGESYESKSAFGSVYKSNLARSIFQAQVVDNQDGFAKAVLRQTKSNFTAKAEPIGLSMSFGKDFVARLDDEAVMIATNSRTVDTTWQSVEAAFIELGGRATANQVSEISGVPIGTVRNKITEHKDNELLDTGQKNGKAVIYELIPNADIHPPVPSPYSDDDEKNSKIPLQLIKDTFGAQEILEGAPF